MILYQYPPEILSIVISFLDNKSGSYISSTCKNLNNHCKTNGYITVMKLNYRTRKINFVRLFCKHARAIQTVFITGVNNPHIWMPRFVDTVIFRDCFISMYIDPGKSAASTRILKIRDCNRNTYPKIDKTVLKVNWSCFKNLQILDLYVYGVDMTGIDELDNLISVNIDTIV